MELTPPSWAVMVTDPAATAVPRPPPVTVAKDVLLEFHATELVMSGALPSL